jgi:hypothetical protein
MSIRFSCARCGRRFPAEGGALCARCKRVFCRRHLTLAPDRTIVCADCTRDAQVPRLEALRLRRRWLLVH